METKTLPNEESTIKKVLRAQVYYLDLLKKHGLLDQALEGRLPPKVEQAAKIVAATAVPGVPYDNETGQFIVSADMQEAVEREIDEYLIHYNLARQEQLWRKPVKLFPRQVTKGGKYMIQSGTFMGGIFELRGEDKEIWGCEWMDNFGHPVCERFLYRCQRDNIPLTGRFYVGRIGDSETLVHESELGLEIR